nr:FAD-dependent 5-carboxymethylaminomethyl-2-thiouridine(34) oxidoreductase MnmC [Candidatus Burkholderia verschuerenii]
MAARLTRAGFLSALRAWKTLEDAGHELHRSRAGRIAGAHVTRGGWFFPHGGAISPAAICAAQLAHAADSLTMRMNTEAARIEYDSRHWHVFDADGNAIAHAPVLVLASAHDATRLANQHGDPTRGVRGQLTMLAPIAADCLRVPVIGDGYAVPLGERGTLIGATYDIDSTDREIRDAGHAENIERVARMLPDIALAQTSVRAGRVAFRCVTSDRMPMIGQFADEAAARRDAQRLSGAWPLDLPRLPGLYGAFAFGSRGLVWSMLAGTDRIADRRRAVADRARAGRSGRSVALLLTRAASRGNRTGVVILVRLWITLWFTGETRVYSLCT